MDLTLEDLTRALSIRRQIDRLEKRLSSLFGGRPAISETRSVSGKSRAKIPGTSRVGTTALKGGAKQSTVRRSAKRPRLSAAGRRKLSQAMKARWAAMRRMHGGGGGGKRARKKMTAAGRRKLSQAMKARWAVKRMHGGGGGGEPLRKGLSAAGRRKLSHAMKARWALRRRVGHGGGGGG
jgi:hypothetical protein